MKPGCKDHWKTKALARRLNINRAQAIGHLEALFILAQEQAPRGDVGKMPNHAIAEELFWEGDADQFVAALCECGFLDRCSTHRVVIHDWEEHCPDYIKRKVREKMGGFAAPAKVVPTPAEPPTEPAPELPQTFPESSGTFQNVPDGGGGVTLPSPSGSFRLLPVAPQPSPPTAGGGAIVPDGVVETEGISGVMRRIIDDYPPCNWPKCGPGEVRKALAVIVAERPEFARSEFMAACWLLERVRAWKASAAFRTLPEGARKSLTKWLGEGVYAGSDSDWAREYVPLESGKGGADARRAEKAGREFDENITVRTA